MRQLKPLACYRLCWCQLGWNNSVVTPSTSTLRFHCLHRSPCLTHSADTHTARTTVVPTWADFSGFDIAYHIVGTAGKVSRFFASQHSSRNWCTCTHTKWPKPTCTKLSRWTFLADLPTEKITCSTLSCRDTQQFQLLQTSQISLPSPPPQFGRWSSIPRTPTTSSAVPRTAPSGTGMRPSGLPSHTHQPHPPGLSPVTWLAPGYPVPWPKAK